MAGIRELLESKLTDAAWRDWRASEPAAVMQTIEDLLKPAVLTNGEGQVMRTLVSHGGTTVSRADLTAQVYDYKHPPASNSLEVLVSRVRAKLKAAGVPVSIKTLRGTGYRLEFNASANREGT